MRILLGINEVTHRSRYMKRVGTKAQGLELQSSFLRHVQERKAQFKKGETQCFVSISLLQFVRPLLLSGLRLRPPPPRPGVTKMCPRLWYPRRQRAEKYFKSVIYSHSRTTAYIPVDSDLSSIKVEGIKMVKAATKL